MAEALASDDVHIAKMKVVAMLEALPKVGKVKARRIMDEIGIDMSRHKSKRLDDLMDTSFEVIVTLSPEAQHKAIELTRVTASEVEYWPTPDPSVAEGHRDARLAAYRDLRDCLIRRIGERFGGDGG